MNEERVNPENFKDYYKLKAFFDSLVGMRVLQGFMKNHNVLIYSAIHGDITDTCARFLYNYNTLSKMGNFLSKRLNPHIGGCLLKFGGTFEEIRELFSRYEGEFPLERKDKNRTILNLMEKEEGRTFEFKVQYTRVELSYYLFKEINPTVDLKCSKIENGIYLLTIFLERYGDFVAVRELLEAINKNENSPFKMDAFELLSTMQNQNTRDSTVSRILFSIERDMDVVGAIGFRGKGKPKKPLSDEWIRNITRMSGEQKIQTIDATLEGMRKDELMSNALDLLLFDRGNLAYRIRCVYDRYLQLKFENCKSLDGIDLEDMVDASTYEDLEEELMTEDEKKGFLERIWERMVLAYITEFE